MKSAVLIAVTCCLFLIPYGEAIKCYNCLADPKVSGARKGPTSPPSWPFPMPTNPCGEYVESSMIDCGAGSTACHSLILDVDGFDEKASFAIKSCGNDKSIELCKGVGTRSLSAKGSCYTCTGDGCNSATSTAINFSVFLVAAAIFKFFN